MAARSSRRGCAAASRTRDSHLRAQYQRLASRRGKKRALVAVSHSILIATWHMLSNEVDYKDLGAGFFLRRVDPRRRTRSLIEQLHALGYQVELTAAGGG